MYIIIKCLQLQRIDVWQLVAGYYQWYRLWTHYPGYSSSFRQDKDVRALLQPSELKYFIIILLPNRIQLSIVFKVHSHAHQTKVCSLFSEASSSCLPILFIVSSSSKLEDSFLYSSDNGVMICTSLLYHQYQKLKCRPGLLFKIYLHSQEATHLCNEIIINQDFGNQLHNQFMIIKRTIGSLFYSHSQYTQVLHD